uniref:Uncharacterized protein n=1 Tax=Pectobacterium carotovorum TaxID=554 RepID=A0A0K0MNU8_PECCA|nr:hypothetical protein [Pectobacterium carotovorum]AKG47495.1 hypothetical protein pA_00055 [Pectobacterium carotovorum]
MDITHNDYELNSKKYIFSLVREFSIRESHSIPRAFAMKVMASSLSDQAKNLVWLSLDSLVNEGIFRKENGNYFLTELGDHTIYGLPSKGSYSLEARKEILNLVRKERLQAGHALTERAIYQFTMMANLNPNVKEALVPELIKMIDEGLFEQTTDNRTLLTAKGFSAVNMA